MKRAWEEPLVIADECPSKRHESERQRTLLTATPLHPDVLSLVTRYAPAAQWRLLAYVSRAANTTYTFFRLGYNRQWEELASVAVGRPEDWMDLSGWSHEDTTIIARRRGQVVVSCASDPPMSFVNPHPLCFTSQRVFVDGARAVFLHSSDQLGYWDYSSGVYTTRTLTRRAAKLVMTPCNTTAVHIVSCDAQSVAKFVLNDPETVPLVFRPLPIPVSFYNAPFKITHDNKWFYHGSHFLATNGAETRKLPESYKNILNTRVSPSMQLVAVCSEETHQHREGLWVVKDYIVTVRVLQWDSFRVLHERQFSTRSLPDRVCMQFSLDDSELVFVKLVYGQLVRWDLLHNTWTLTPFPSNQEVVDVVQC